MKSKILNVTVKVALAVVLVFAGYTAGRMSVKPETTEPAETVSLIELLEPDDEQTVYWVDGGEVYHTSADCRSLSRSTDIHGGTIADSGKARACKICG